MPAPKIEKPGQKPFTELHQERMKEVQEKVSGKVDYNPNAQENIAALAAKVYEDKPENIERYKTKILRSLEKHLAEGKTVEDLWAWLKEQNCNSTAIIMGMLRFFGKGIDEEGKEFEKELNISGFLKPAEIKAVSQEGETMEALRTQEIQKTRLALSDLLSEIQGNKNKAPSTLA